MISYFASKKIQNIRSLVSHSLNFRKQAIQNLYTRVKKFQNMYVDSFSKKIGSNVEENEIILREFYGGDQFHLKSNDPSFKQLNFGYIDLNNNCTVTEISSSQPLPNLNNSSNITEEIINIHLTQIREQQPKKLFGRYCDQFCDIPQLWANNLFCSFKTIAPVYNFKLLQQNLLEFEICPECIGDENRQCNSIKKCRDNVRVMKNLSEHYQHLRSIVRAFYLIRQVNITIMQIDKYLLEGNYLELASITAFKTNTTEQLVKSKIKLIVNSQQLDHSRLNVMFDAIQKDLNITLPTFQCVSCNRMLNKPQVRALSTDELNDSILKQLNFNSSHSKIYLCRTQCFNDIFIKKRKPIYSHLNNMHMDSPPIEITRLNFYEKILCQLAKCFQTIVKLQTCKKFSGSNQILALKGSAIHLPITFESTHDYLTDDLPKQIPNADALHILVNGLPTKTNNIWRSLVNLEYVISAANWLKSNNHYYKDVQIMEINKKSSSALLLPENATNKSTNRHLPDVSYLARIKDEDLTHFSVIDLDKENINRPDIEKYITKKVVTEPMKDRDNEIDHLCFIDLFPYGRGGMYDSRPIERIKPAMYLRWVLHQANPYARRNFQYIFSAINNKDIRSVNYGIFATMRSSKDPNLNAAKLINLIESGDRELETSLGHTLTALRGSQQFWSMKCSDLNAMDEKFGGATFFGTVAFSEYNDNVLFQYLKERNPDLVTPQITLAKLIASDPLSVSVYCEKRFRTYFKKVIKSVSCPLGEVTHYFWRREYQVRGMPHFHWKIWVKDAPVHGKNSDEEVLKFITTHISCRIPNRENEPELYDLVMRYQIHKCTSSCQRLVCNPMTKMKKKQLSVVMVFRVLFKNMRLSILY